MANDVIMAFEAKSVHVRLTDILPVKQLPKGVLKTRKFLQIAASIREVGIIEPPVVIREPKKKGKFLLLDGHLRIEVLRDMGTESVTCLVATDDEAFTYNKRINRLAIIQEHKMILKAVEGGVPEERIARALDVNVASIRKKRRLLHGICPEAAELLKDRHCPINSFLELRKMKPMRQVEVVELMIAMDNYSVSYAKALFAATPQDQLADAQKTKPPRGLSDEQISRMEVEMANLQREMKLIEDNYGPDHLNLVLARGYVTSLLKNPNVVRYIEKHHDGILEQFRAVSERDSMGAEAAVS